LKLAQIAEDDDRLLGALRRRCSIGVSSVFAFHDCDLQNDANSTRGDAISKLQRTLLDCAIQHYLGRARRIKKWEKTLQRGGPLWAPLVARYSFKIAWFYEFQGNSDKALRHYRLAYASLSALVLALQATEPANTLNLFPKEFTDPGGQVKGVADYANYKVCRLSLQHNKVEEAATQMQTHLWHFRQTAGDTPHQHWGWLSRQHVVFAQLLTHHCMRNFTTSASNQTPYDNLSGSPLIRASTTPMPSAKVPADVTEYFGPEIRSTVKHVRLTPLTPQNILSSIEDISWTSDRRDVLVYAEPLYHYAAAAAFAVRRHAALRNLPMSNFSSERLGRISLAAPEFVGALPRVSEENNSAQSKPQIRDVMTASASPRELNVEEALCRAALDHIARGFDHVAMVSELLQEGLDILERLHCTTKQRRTAWLHAALGNEFSKAESVSLDLEAIRHLDAALSRYEDSEAKITSGVANSWAWPRAFLLEHLGCCALRLGDATLCVSVFLKLAHFDMRFFLSDPVIAIAAQRDAVTLLTKGTLDSNSDTAILRGFSTSRFGESRSQLKDSKNRTPAKTALDQGLVEWAVKFDGLEARAGAMGLDDKAQSAAVVELRLKIFTPEPLNVKHLELVFRSHTGFQETIIADSRDIFCLDTNKQNHCRVILPGLVYAWRGNATAQAKRCGSAETLLLILAETALTVVVSANPGISALFEVGCVKKDYFHPNQTTSTIMKLKILLEGPRFVFAGVPTLIMATVTANQPISNHTLVVGATTVNECLNVTFQHNGTTGIHPAYATTAMRPGQIVFSIENSKIKVVGFWVTCHGDTKLTCTVASDRLSAANEDIEEEHLSNASESQIELTVLSPFLVTFKMMKSPIHSDAQIFNLEKSEIHWNRGEIADVNTLKICCGKSAKFRCTIQNTQPVPIVIKHVRYKSKIGMMSYIIYPKQGTRLTTLTQREILAVQLSTPPLNSGMKTSQNRGCIVVCWSPVTEGVISTQVIETCILCPEAIVIQPTVSCKLDVPSRAHLCHPLVATWHVENKTSYPLMLEVKSSTNIAFASASKRQRRIELMRQESIPLDMTLIPLYIGINTLSDFCLMTTLTHISNRDCKRNKTTVFVDPSF